MTLPSTVPAADGYDASPDFVYAVSLIAALETAPAAGHVVRPLLGMARAELTDFGQRRPAHYVEVTVTNIHAALVELEERLIALRAGSQMLQHSLRADAALRLLHRGLAVA